MDTKRSTTKAGTFKAVVNNHLPTELLKGTKQLASVPSSCVLPGLLHTFVNALYYTFIIVLHHAVIEKMLQNEVDQVKEREYKHTEEEKC